ncbi:7606_t:CDS:2, partial [Gigaspora rosea]
QGIVISESDQGNTNESILEPDDALTIASSALHADVGQENASTLKKNKAKKRNSVTMRPHSTNIKVNNYQNIRNLENDRQDIVILEDDQGNTNESVLESDNALTTTSSALHADVGQENASTLKKNKAKKQNLAPIWPCTQIFKSTIIKILEISKMMNNIRKGLRSFAQKFNNIETISKIVEGDAQDSDKKRKREQMAKKTSSHSVRA